MLKRSIALFTLLVALLGVTLIAPAQSSVHAESAKAQGTQCQNYDITHGGFGYVARFNGQYCFDGHRVWVTRLDCSYIYYGVSISQTYCGITHNNDGWAEVGSNYQASAIINGSPLGWPGYARATFLYNGQTGQYGSRF